MNTNTIKNGIFTPLEQERLEKSILHRETIVNEMFKNGIPTKVGEIRVLNELLNSNDRSIHDTALARLKHQDNQNKGAIREAVVEALKMSQMAKLENIDVNRELEVGDEVIPIDTVPDETSINHVILNLEEIMSEDEE